MSYYSHSPAHTFIESVTKKVYIFSLWSVSAGYKLKCSDAITFGQLLDNFSIWMVRLRAASKAQADGVKKPRIRERVKAVPAPEANAELQTNIDVCSDFRQILIFPNYMSDAFILTSMHRHSLVILHLIKFKTK